MALWKRSNVDWILKSLEEVNSDRWLVEFQNYNSCSFWPFRLLHEGSSQEKGMAHMYTNKIQGEFCFIYWPQEWKLALVCTYKFNTHCAHSGIIAQIKTDFFHLWQEFFFYFVDHNIQKISHFISPIRML